jgi:hypothetical protein
MMGILHFLQYGTYNVANIGATTPVSFPRNPRLLQAGGSVFVVWTFCIVSDSYGFCKYCSQD